MSGFLKVDGTNIVDGNNRPIVLTGAAIGGHLNMENFITGYPGHETEHKKVIKSKIGEDKFEYFFDKFYEYFWTDLDAKFYQELGFNCLRVPFNYRHFLNDEGDLFDINTKGFERLDKIVNSCAKHNIFTVLDLHAVPGGQCQQWFNDNPTHFNHFWEFKIFQDSIINLWEKIALYYKDNTWVAGYNPLNEPAVADGSKLVKFYQRIDSTIRAVDKNHMLFLDANNYAMDFSDFPDTPFANSAYAIHDYTEYGFPKGLIAVELKEPYKGTDKQKAELQAQYDRKIQFMKKHNVPVWNGEFGPVYASDFRGDSDPESINKVRYQVLKDQLQVYKKGNPSGDGSPISWSIWLYKDIGLQGLTYVSTDSKWYQVFGDWLKKKKDLGLDSWGCDIKPEYEKYYKALGDHFRDNIPEKYYGALYPPFMDIDTYISRVTREMLFSQYCQHEYADLFVGLDYDELDELAASFKFENCIKRDELNSILKTYK